MHPRTRRCRRLLTLAFVLAPFLGAGCGSGSVPDGGQINVTIPPEVAKQQNDAFKNYSKQSKKGKPPG